MSKNLDDELAALAGGSLDEVVGSGGGRKPSEARQAPAAPAKKRNLALLLTLLAMVGAVVVLFLLVFQPAAVYATPVDKLVKGGQLVGRKVRVEGELVPGTLVKRDQPCEYRFTIHKDDVQLPVRYPQCVIPDGFRDVPSGGVQVTVEGALTPDGAFDASLVMAKCSSKYDPAKHEMKDGPGALPVN